MSNLNTEAVIKRLHEYLVKNGPYPSYSHHLARRIGVSGQQIVVALSRVRSVEWIEEHGWTIPYVGQGTGKKNPYMVVTGRNEAVKYLHPGVRFRGSDLLGSLRRWDAHADMGVGLLDGRSAEGKWMIAASAQVKAMIQMAEVLGL